MAIGNTKITCHACGRYGYYLLEDPIKVCKFCGSELESIQPTPVSGNYPKQAQQAMRQAVNSNVPKKQYRKPEDSQEQQYMPTWQRELRQLRNEQANCKIFLLNGFQINGQIADFDRDCVVALSDGIRKVIQRHAISTIEPKP